MAKGITFTENDKELIDRIKKFQKAQQLRSFTEAVRVLCENGLGMSKIVKGLK